MSGIDGVEVLRRVCAKRIQRRRIEQAHLRMIESEQAEEAPRKRWLPRLERRDDGVWTVVDTGLEPTRLAKQQVEPFRLAMTHHVNVNLEWSRGTGKSWWDRFLAWCWIARADGVPRHELLESLGVPLEVGDPEDMAKNRKGVRIIFLMPTLKQFRNVHGNDLINEVSQWGHLEPHPNWTTYEIKFPGGSTITPFPGEEYTSKRARGLRGDIVIGDEADDTPIAVWDSVIRPWMTEPWSLGIKVTSGTFRKGRHGLLYKRRQAAETEVAEKTPSSERRFFTFHATYRDCPELVSPAEVEEARRTTDPAIFESEWECNPDSPEGLVYGRTFDPNFHVREPPEGLAWQEILVGRDYGDEDPGCLLFGGVIGHGLDSVLWILDEVYERRRLPGWWKEQLKVRALYYAAYGGKPKYYPDPSRPGDNVEEAKMCGVRLQKVDNSVPEGISAVSNMLAVRERRDDKGEVASRYARLYIAPKCVNLLTEMGMSCPGAIADGQYRRKPDKEYPGKFLDEVVDKHNHACDTLKYMVFNRFGTPKRR